MARGIQNFGPNVTAPDADYLDGNVKDIPNGTPVNKLTLSDMWQFFAKVMRTAGLTFNNLPDNESNGYQLFDALQKAAKPYNSYSAIIQQAGSAAPAVNTLLTNELSGTVVWSRSSAGNFGAALVGEFPVAKTMVFINGTNVGKQLVGVRFDDDNILFLLQDFTGAAQDGFFAYVEIRVYR